MLREKLKEARLRKGLPQAEVASYMGCAPATITNWESGKFNPPLEQLEKVCQLYEVSPLDLLEHYPSMDDIYQIVKKKVSERTYEETVALTFSGELSGWVEEDDTKEAEIVRIYHSLNAEGRDLFYAMVKGVQNK